MNAPTFATRPPQYPWARQSAGHAPPRLPGSVRRTTSIDSAWPGGFGQPVAMSGRARDIVTPLAGGAPVELAGGGFAITASQAREILAIEVTPPHPRTAELVGVRAGGASREAFRTVLRDRVGTPLFQVLDDFAGASLVGNWIWSQWCDDWRPGGMAQMPAGTRGPRENICTGFATGASSLSPDGLPDTSGTSHTEVGPLTDPADPLGWHAMPEQSGVKFRRARRLDLYRDGDLLHADLGFQDSGSNPRGTRSALHEYRVHAEIDPATMTLVSLQALPLILPFRECPGAAVKIGRLVGQPVAGLRDAVPVVLRSTLGCTHLNDVLRSLADVPDLARMLP